jgi:hypothetical protein
MIRVFDFRIEGMEQPIRLASMSEEIVKKFLAEGVEMAEKYKASALPDDAWLERRRRTISDSMNRARKNGDAEWDAEKIRSFDLPTQTAMHDFIVEKSGLRMPSEGEVKAASTSAN